jgi:hypothetical protein
LIQSRTAATELSVSLVITDAAILKTAKQSEVAPDSIFFFISAAYSSAVGILGFSAGSESCVFGAPSGDDDEDVSDSDWSSDDIS